MIAGPRFAEGKVLALAHAFEQATAFHAKRPPIRPDTPVPPLAATEDGKPSASISDGMSRPPATNRA